jgi:hypothetical protein
MNNLTILICHLLQGGGGKESFKCRLLRTTLGELVRRILKSDKEHWTFADKKCWKIARGIPYSIYSEKSGGWIDMRDMKKTLFELGVRAGDKLSTHLDDHVREAI